MNIPYYLQDLPIGPEPDHKIGRIQVRGSFSEQNLLDRMTQRGTGISREDMQATLDLFTKVVVDSLTEGWAINTRLANYKPGIKGIFNGATDPFDPGRHHFRATLSEGVELKNKMRVASGERVTVPLPAPFLIQYTDYGSHTVDSTLTPGNIGEINGQALKYNPENENEGVFLIPEAGGDATRVESVSILTEGRLMFMVPTSLAAGEYIMEVRKAYTNEASIRTGTLHHTLVVL
ncbi:DUF4469 domain-containing protein [Leptobacterium flavescens]|uniref:DUF4469 domain-containing protein n=1 Tax=Leptobacterium flavescens TaxID=472055 RepID=A0A6P0UJL0_9FLAO|nr:DNA-binding domain-containing protein [Leptobacterium flavescens]NER13384.1 DUF4469 domain-containing protein [Leptobacterium flavescens]